MLVGQVLHRGTESTLKMSYLECFSFSFCQRYMVNERRHNSAKITALHMFHVHYSTRERVVHILDNSNFCVRKSFFLCIAWICTHFDHLASPLDFKSSVHRVLNNTDTMLVSHYVRKIPLETSNTNATLGSAFFTLPALPAPRPGSPASRRKESRPVAWAWADSAEWSEVNFISGTKDTNYNRLPHPVTLWEL